MQQRPTPTRHTPQSRRSELLSQACGHLPPLCTVGEAASTFRCSPRTVKTWIAKGLLHSMRALEGPGTSRVLIPRAEIERLVAEGLR